ncbi:MAG: bifunctional (p)ppGpp synthetase/guanosine-3',5'-bis(diphosphate) 3'-pyrophosphohydrolase [Flavobacteriales bacterium]|nr:bifunctional (p)ppGpp synthetase/guanosine-3',5'-bis(diphosphate) 3'-pyrophosphohydrolase [Flavobacteriales bacterium]
MTVENIDLEKENKDITQAYKELLRVSYRTLSEEDKKLIRKAFDVAVDAHKEQRRKSGEAYIFHPIAVAKIVAEEIGLGATAIASALLHDVVEDTPITSQDIEKMFGIKIARIVEGLTKISKVKTDHDISIQAENFRKMLLTLNDDIRVILIKIADRLHNMQTMNSMKSNKQEQISSETLYIYAPLAHRLGLYNIKTQLEDLGLKYTEPEIFEEIQNKISETKEEQEQYIKELTDKLDKALKVEISDYTITGRPKSIFSIRRKMRDQGVPFEKVFDKFALRIVYKSSPENEKFLAWKIYSVITDNYQPNPSRLRDWISSPKNTGYEALHTTVMGHKGRWVEVQIRSERMNEIAEKGYAAHYKYKNSEEDEEKEMEELLNDLKEALVSANSNNAIDFVEDFKLNLYAKEIYVFTPNGDIKSLPKGAMPLDFAFSIHTEIGYHAKGAKINGKLVPLNTQLISGDQVEIITDPTQKPNPSWLDYVVTSRARSRIKNILNDDQKKKSDYGKELLLRKLRRLKIDFSEEIVNELVLFLHLKTSADLFYKIGTGTIDNATLKKFASERSTSIYNFFKKKIRRNASSPKKTEGAKEKHFDSLVFGDAHDRLEYTLATCCHPIAGDEVFGFITVNEGIKVHRKDCSNSISLQSKYIYRIIKARWINSLEHEFPVTLEIKGIDSIGLASELTRVISNNMNVNIKTISLSSDAGIFHGTITLIVQNNTVLSRLINNIKKLDGIEKVTRVYQN